MRISVVIPTRNRPEFIERVLFSFHNQTRKADEIIIVDSSDDKIYSRALESKFDFPIRWMDSIASVCIQRNIGIRAASGDWIFLCDDDIELAPDYLEKLEDYCNQNSECGVCAGLLLQQEREQWVSSYPVKGVKDLTWRFIFQLSVWGDFKNIPRPAYTQPLLYFIEKFYHQRQNTLTLAGWPLITSWRENVFQTSIYSLGANLVKKQWLLESPYDEVLDASGIGDNYGVVKGFPGQRSIHVLGSTVAYHHRATKNRLEKPLSYYRRILALHYFIKKERPKNLRQELWFFWSLVGNACYFLLKRETKMTRATIKVMWLIMRNKNPYWIGFKRNERIIQPSLRL